MKVSLVNDASMKPAGSSADKSRLKTPEIALAEFQRIRDEIDNRSVMQQALLGAGVLSLGALSAADKVPDILGAVA